MSRNTRAMRAGAYQDFTTDLNHRIIRMSDVPGLDTIVSSGMVDMHKLNNEQLLHFNLWMTSVASAYENAYYQFRMGLFDSERWRMHRQGLEGFLQVPGARQWWEAMAPRILQRGNPEFASLVEEILGKEREGDRPH